jgi:hypothetical protein
MDLTEIKTTGYNLNIISSFNSYNVVYQNSFKIKTHCTDVVSINVPHGFEN